MLVAGSLEQARICFRVARRRMEPKGGYDFTDGANRIAIKHPATRTGLRLIGSNPKTAFGLLDTPYALLDECGAWELQAGAQLFDSIETAMGKPDSDLKIIAVSTLVPFAVEGHWWHGLVTGGSSSDTHVEYLAGDPEKWDQWREIRRCNPLVAVSADFRKRLLKERNDARGDTRLAARFKSFRLNLSSPDESVQLLSGDDWERTLARPVPPRVGKPIVGIDIGAGRAWSSAVAVHPSGLVSALALAPGLPDLATQETRDRVPLGTYRRIAEQGALQVAEGLRVQPVSQLLQMVLSEWGRPAFIICDRFRLGDVQDCAGGIEVVPRVTRWSEAAAGGNRGGTTSSGAGCHTGLPGSRTSNGSCASSGTRSDPFVHLGWKLHLERPLRRHLHHPLPYQLVVEGHGQRVRRRQAQRNLPVSHQSRDPIPQPVDVVLPPVPVEVAALAQCRQVQQRRLLRPLVPYVCQGEHHLAPRVRMRLVIDGAAPLAPPAGAVLDDEPASETPVRGVAPGLLRRDRHQAAAPARSTASSMYAPVSLIRRSTSGPQMPV